MNAEQKSAWFTVAVILATVLGYFILLAVLGNPWQAVGIFGLYGLLGLTPFFFGRRRQLSETSVDLDERDHSIARRATLRGGIWSYLFFVLASVGLYFHSLFAGRDVIQARWLPVMVFGGATVLLMARALSLLLQYRHSAKLMYED